jgi:hypothetical protein
LEIARRTAGSIVALGWTVTLEVITGTALPSRLPVLVGGSRQDRVSIHDFDYTGLDRRG